MNEVKSIERSNIREIEDLFKSVQYYNPIPRSEIERMSECGLALIKHIKELEKENELNKGALKELAEIIMELEIHNQPTSLYLKRLSKFAHIMVDYSDEEFERWIGE